MLGQNFRRTTSGSISAPARKVRRMAPKPARKLTQGASGRPTRLPATAPTTISVRATEIATHIESTDAISAKPIHKADASQTLSMPSSMPRRGAALRRPTVGRSGRWHAREASQTPPHPLRGRGHQPSIEKGGFGEPHPRRRCNQTRTLAAPVQYHRLAQCRISTGRSACSSK
jgi:hypothetical protein